MRERGRANGVMFLGSRDRRDAVGADRAAARRAHGAGVPSFVVFGAIGLVWAAAWYAWYRDRPEDHPGVGRGGTRVDPAGSIAAPIRTSGRRRRPRRGRALLRSRNLYAICAMYFAFGYGLYFYFTWLPTYLIKELGFSLLSGGLFAALPFLLAGIADIVGGWLTDFLTRQRGLEPAAVTSASAHSSRARHFSSHRRIVAVANPQSDAAGDRAGVSGPRAWRVLGGAD